MDSELLRLLMELLSTNTYNYEHMTKDDDYTNVLLEQIRDQNKAVLEAVGQVQERVELLATKEDLRQLETKVDTIQAAVTYTNKDLLTLDGRVTRLEQAA
jgi:hypothetical protein